MTRPVLTFFNNKGGVGKTMLAYHVAWMLSELGRTVLVIDLDPQANLTASFLGDDRVEQLWERGQTAYGSLAPLFEGEGGIADPHVEDIASNLKLVAGDLLLSGTEQQLSLAWPGSLEGQPRDLRVMAAFSNIAQRAAESSYADIILVDVGPNLGAINRAAMTASDHVVIPMRPDLYSLQGLRNLGPTLDEWRQGWHDRVTRASRRGLHRPDLQLPSGEMRPRGYVVLQHGTRVDRVVGAYDRWLQRIPREYRLSVLGEALISPPPPAADDPQCLGLIKHYYSLAPMAQEARKPIFLLRSADGAIGAHQQAVRDAYGHFESLTLRLLGVAGLGSA
jgi:chromosome partitioning protein